MANIYQPSYYEPLPRGAKIVEKTVRGKKQKVAEFVRRGKTVQAPLTPDGKRVRLRSPTWWGRWRDRTGREHAKPLSREKAAAQILMGELLRKREFGRPGIVPPEERFAVHAERPLSDHLDDYKRFLEAKGRNPRHCRTTHFRAKAVCDGCGFVTSADLSGSKVTEWVAGLAKPTEQYEDGLGPTTRNGYITAVKSFVRWMVRDGRLPADPLAALSREPDAEATGDVRVRRRALTAKELGKLVRAAARSKTKFRGLDGQSRAVLYLTAMGTGFRASELASLTPANVALDGKPPIITVAAAYTKNGQRAEQPITPDLATELRRHIHRRRLKAEDALWPGGWNDNAAEMMKSDRDAAKVKDEIDGATADFHALRHSYITALAADPTVSVKTLQSLARHSTPNLTLKLYAKARCEDRVMALESLPRVARSLEPDRRRREI